MQTVAVLGASRNTQRYSHQALARLLEHGHQALPVSPTGESILGQPGFRRLTEIQQSLDTVTVYINAARLEELIPDLLASEPGRVILNPGTESPSVRRQLEEAGIEVLEACTLVLLATGQFE